MLINYEILRKKILYKSCNRGLKETDILLGEFAKKNINNLSEQQLVKFDELLDEADVDIFNWITGKVTIPKQFDNDIIKKLINVILQPVN